MSIHTKQVAALKLAIESLERERRARFAAGDAAYRRGVRKDVIQDADVTGTVFAFAEDDHASYERYTRAIQELDDLIDILTDPGVTMEQEQLFQY